MTAKYNLFSLFSGAGGLDLGFKQTGRFSTIFGNDIRSPAVETFSTNFGIKQSTTPPRKQDLPSVFLGDVAEINPVEFEDLESDLVIGGPPCQDFSIVRGPDSERMGIDVSRGKLYSHFVRSLIYLQPKMFVFENVPGLRSSNQGKAYEMILEDFSNLNLRWKTIKEIVGNNDRKNPHSYEIIYSDVVNAANLGVPQARKRLIIVGLRKDLFDSAWWKISSLKEKVEGTLGGVDRLVSRYPLTTMEVFEGKTLPDLEDRYVEVMEEYSEIAKEAKTPITLKWRKEVWDNLSFNIVEDYTNINKIAVKSRNEIDEAFDEHAELLKELGYYGTNVSKLKLEDRSTDIRDESTSVTERMKRVPPNENHIFVKGTEWDVKGRGISLIYRRAHPLKPSYTIVAHGGGGTWGYHYERHRGVLTNRERARLQTFPDQFEFKGGISQVRTQLGEAVPPLMAKRIAQLVISFLDELC